ncbi:MAG: SdiA-regulated domain-containing protein [Candidatus Eremiobacteraeota bacterium]|nr:SdiA-regulated domain-containing protein [Candidatus Eremiobacteraeota bacterium]
MKKRFCLYLFLLLFLSFFSTGLVFGSKLKTIIFPYSSIEKLDRKEKIEEPSGIAYHPMRKTLFVVSDDGDIYEIDLNGKILAKKHISAQDNDELDPEGVAINTRTGEVYVAAEEIDGILVIDPATLKITGIFKIINKDEKGKPLFREGGNGFEGIAFVPGKKAGYDRIYICNQHDPPIVMKVPAPSVIKKRFAGKKSLKVLGWFRMPCTDLSGMTYHNSRKTLFILSDFNNTLFEVSTDGKILNQWSVPGQDQEGIAFAGNYVYIAQDSGKIIKAKIQKSFASRCDKK